VGSRGSKNDEAAAREEEVGDPGAAADKDGNEGEEREEREEDEAAEG